MLDIPAKKGRATLQYAKSVPPTFATPSENLSEPGPEGLVFLEASGKRLRHTSPFAFALTVAACVQGVVDADAYAGIRTPEFRSGNVLLASFLPQVVYASYVIACASWRHPVCCSRQYRYH